MSLRGCIGKFSLTKKMKKFLKKQKRLLILWIEAFHDMLRFWNALESTNNKQLHLEGAIIRHYHVIEKGLSMKNFRPRFGVPVVQRLCKHLQQWHEPVDKITNGQVEAAYTVLICYRNKHRGLGVDILDILGSYESSLDAYEEANLKVEGGLKMPLAANPNSLKAFQNIVKTRSSIRWFMQDQLPEMDLIREALGDAITTPSVCNRQTWRVHSYAGEEAGPLLDLQSGNRGFGHQIPMLLVVTSDLCYFTGPKERYQAWIDGGMFAMTLVLALHVRGLGSVCLNWSVKNKVDKEFRLKAEISDNERIIMLIGVGLPDFKKEVPFSARKTVEDVLRVH